MCYRIAGIDVHKKMLAVVVSDVEIESEYQFERRMFSSSPEQLRSLAAWLVEQEAEEVVMESTAQYWKPVWEALERYWKPLREEREGARRRSGKLHLAQAESNRGRRGRKRDWSSSSIIFRRWVTGIPPVTHTYIKAIKQPTLHYLTRSVRRRAATSYVGQVQQLRGANPLPNLMEVKG